MSTPTGPVSPNSQPPQNPQPPSPSSPPPPAGQGGDSSYLDWPFVKMFTQAGAPPPTRDQALQMINQAIKTMLSDQIEQANKAHKEAMQRMKEAFEDQ